MHTPLTRGTPTREEVLEAEGKTDAFTRHPEPYVRDISLIADPEVPVA